MTDCLLMIAYLAVTFALAVVMLSMRGTIWLTEGTR
jgi:hypothetical protein